MSQRLKDRIALVTGASRGIGHAVALAFAREGAHIVATARTTGGLEELDDEIQAVGGSATLVPVDLSRGDKVDTLGPAIYERLGGLDIFVANAGLLGTLSPLAHADPKTWEQVMALNVNANQRLIRTVDPLLRRSEAGRAVFVTSTVGHEARAYWSAYAVSKAALEMMARIYAEETRKTTIKVNLLNPGATRTGMRAKAYPGEKPENVKPPEAVAEAFIRLAAVDCPWHGEMITADDFSSE